MTQEDILIGKGAEQLHLDARYANRHGLVAGATGTGKTVTLMLMAEGFSRMGVPVFMADAKGDIAGLAAAGTLVLAAGGSLAVGADRGLRLLMVGMAAAATLLLVAARGLPP